MPFAAGVYSFLRAGSVAVKSIRYFTDELDDTEEWVQSTCIKSASYNSAKEVLRLTFTDGTSYKYFNISKDHYDGLRDSLSKGQDFNFNIRNAGFGYTKIG